MAQTITLTEAEYIEASALEAEEHVGDLMTGVLNALLISVCLFWAPLIIALTVLR